MGQLPNTSLLCREPTDGIQNTYANLMKETREWLATDENALPNRWYALKQNTWKKMIQCANEHNDIPRLMQLLAHVPFRTMRPPYKEWTGKIDAHIRMMTAFVQREHSAPSDTTDTVVVCRQLLSACGGSFLTIKEPVSLLDCRDQLKKQIVESQRQRSDVDNRKPFLVHFLFWDVLPNTQRLFSHITLLLEDPQRRRFGFFDPNADSKMTLDNNGRFTGVLRSEVLRGWSPLLHDAFPWIFEFRPDRPYSDRPYENPTTPTNSLDDWLVCQLVFTMTHRFGYRDLTDTGTAILDLSRDRSWVLQWRPKLREWQSALHKATGTETVLFCTGLQRETDHANRSPPPVAMTCNHVNLNGTFCTKPSLPAPLMCRCTDHQ